MFSDEKGLGDERIFFFDKFKNEIKMYVINLLDFVKRI